MAKSALNTPPPRSGLPTNRFARKKKPQARESNQPVRTLRRTTNILFLLFLFLILQSTPFLCWKKRFLEKKGEHNQSTASRKTYDYVLVLLAKNSYYTYIRHFCFPHIFAINLDTFKIQNLLPVYTRTGYSKKDWQPFYINMQNNTPQRTAEELFLYERQAPDLHTKYTVAWTTHK